MRKILIAATGLLALAALPAHAIIDSDFGVKAGMLSVDGDSTAATQAGLVWNMEVVSMLGVEFEYNTSIQDGEFDVLPGTVAEYSADQFGAYGVLMTPGPVYFKGKVGYVRTSIDGFGQDDSDQAAAYGVGIGFTAVEIEYTRTKYKDTDVDLISASFKF